MKHIANITGDQYRAAFLCKGSDSDVREYLCGLHLHLIPGKGGNLVSTNGHIMICTPVTFPNGEPLPDEGAAITFRGPKLPASVERVEVLHDAETGQIMLRTFDKKLNRVMHSASAIDCKYVDYNAPIPKDGQEVGISAPFAFDSKYLDIVSKALKGCGVWISMHDPKSPALIRPVPVDNGARKRVDIPAETRVVLMPIRI